MQVDIKLYKHSDSQCTISSSEQDGMCWIELKEGNRDIGCMVSIEDLKLALRKISVK